MVGPFDCRYLKNRELSNDDDDDGSENVAKKLNLPRFIKQQTTLSMGLPAG